MDEERGVYDGEFLSLEVKEVGHFEEGGAELVEVDGESVREVQQQVGRLLLSAHDVETSGDQVAGRPSVREVVVLSPLEQSHPLLLLQN